MKRVGLLTTLYPCLHYDDILVFLSLQDLKKRRDNILGVLYTIKR